MRNFLGLSLLFLGLLAATYDGFRDRERIRTATPGSSTTTTESTVHAMDGILFGNPPR